MMISADKIHTVVTDIVADKPLLDAVFVSLAIASLVLLLVTMAAIYLDKGVKTVELLLCVTVAVTMAAVGTAIFDSGAQDRHRMSLHPSVSSIAEKSGLHEVTSGVYRSGDGTLYGGCVVDSQPLDARHLSSTLYCAKVTIPAR